MRNKVVRWFAGVALTCGALPAMAQEPPKAAPKELPKVTEVAGAPAPIWAPVTGVYMEPQNTHAPRFYAGAEYLMWWIKSAPVVPLVTTGTGTPPTPPTGAPLNDSAGVLGSGNATVVLGGSDIDFGMFSGGRFTVGGWNCDGSLGLEASGFFLAQQSQRSSVGSDAAGNPLLTIPFLNAAGQETAAILTVPANIFGFVLAGTATLEARSELWGAEANGMFNLRQTSTSRLDGLIGFRYASLEESLRFGFASTLSVGGTPLNTFTTNDQYDTRSQFYGAQLGLRYHQDLGKFFVDVTGKIALGTNENIATVNGSSTDNTGTSAKGFFVPGAAVGSQSRHDFSVMPEVTAALGMHITQNLSASVGYNFMYWSNVVRPGDQIDRQGNAVQSNTALFNTTDFWAQGINFGAQYKY